jgi:hypothetical protein
MGEFRVSGSFAALRMTARTSNGKGNNNCNNNNSKGNGNCNGTPPFALQRMGHPHLWL